MSAIDHAKKVLDAALLDLLKTYCEATAYEDDALVNAVAHVNAALKLLDTFSQPGDSPQQTGASAPARR